MLRSRATTHFHVPSSRVGRHFPHLTSLSKKTLLLRTKAYNADNAADDDNMKEAARLLAEEFTSNGSVIGIGTGIPINEYLKELAVRLDDGRLQNVRCIPSSDVSASEAAFHGVPLTTIADSNTIDLFIDVADEMDINTLDYIVGRGGNGPQANQPSLPRVRQLLEVATTVVVVALASGTRMGGSVPVLIDGNELEWEDTAEELDDMFLGDAEVRRRSLDVMANPRGGNTPVVTEDGHMILDIQFNEGEGGLKLYGEEVGYDVIGAEIGGVEGVVTHGLVTGEATFAVVIDEELGVEVLSRAPVLLEQREDGV